MTLQDTASRLRQTLGPTHPVVRLLRPVYEVVLDLATLGRGYRRTVNGVDTFYVHPRARRLVPEQYEPEVYAHVRAVARAGWQVLNIGTHVGIYTLLLAQRVGPTGRVWAFEPNPATRRLLASHVRRNAVTDRVHVRPEAVSRTPGVMPFVASGVEGYSRLGTPHPDGPVVPYRTVQVPVTSVDAFCQAHGIRPDLLLVDVEGYEGEVLAGAEHTLTAHPDMEVIVEFHPEVWEPGTREALSARVARFGRHAQPLTPAVDPYAEHAVVRLAVGR